MSKIPLLPSFHFSLFSSYFLIFFSPLPFSFIIPSFPPFVHLRARLRRVCLGPERHRPCLAPSAPRRSTLLLLLLSRSHRPLPRLAPMACRRRPPFEPLSGQRWQTTWRSSTEPGGVTFRGSTSLVEVGRGSRCSSLLGAAPKWTVRQGSSRSWFLEPEPCQRKPYLVVL